MRRLAAVAERERIARDLHDLLGHTLSVITIKAELAAKLAARGDRRAEQEMREVESISRGALREVREAVVGFRRADLDAELANARLACEAGDIRLAVDRPSIELLPDREAVLAMSLREAITNVVRHADARHCRTSLAREGERIRLTVADDGRGGVIREGAGLAGMRERVEQARGEMTIELPTGGWRRCGSRCGPSWPSTRASPTRNQPAVITDALARRTQQRQHGDRQRTDQQQAVPSVRARNMHRRKPHPEAHVLDVPKARLNPPALAVVANQDPRRDLRFAGHQAPRFVHLRILYAHDRADRQLVRVGHPSTHQPPRTPPAPTHAAAVRRSPPALVT